ncbi:MAG: GAF domain-containing protein [Firmicutes bacterium]|nr:GAF domain-containing protein [Bacillota bacterium]
MDTGDRGTAAKLVDLACVLWSAPAGSRFMEEYLERVAELIPARAYGFYLFRHDRLEPYDWAVIGVSGSFVRKYERLRSRDPVFLSAIRTGQPFHSDLVPAETWARGPAYELLAEQGIPRCMDCPLPSPVTGRYLGVLNVARGPEEPCFGPEDVALSGLIARLTGAALEHYAELARPDVLGRLLEAFRDAAPAPAVLSHRELQVATCNRAELTARLLLEHQRPPGEPRPGGEAPERGGRGPRPGGPPTVTH